MRTVLSALLLLASMASPSFALAAAAATADAWHLVTERDGIRVYVQQRDGLKAFRGIADYEVRDWYAIGAAVNDFGNVPRWLYFVSAVQEIGRRNDTDRDLLIQTDLPWPVADREAIVRARAWNVPGTWDTVVRFENAPSLLPPNEDYIRFPQLTARFDFHWLGGRRMQVTYEVVADPGGWIPVWLADIVLRDAPYYTLKRFAKVLERPDYQGRRYDYIVTPPGFGK